MNEELWEQERIKIAAAFQINRLQMSPFTRDPFWHQYRVVASHRQEPKFYGLLYGNEEFIVFDELRIGKGAQETAKPLTRYTERTGYKVSAPRLRVFRNGNHLPQLIRALFLLRGEEFLEPLGVQISAHEKLEWMLDYRQRMKHHEDTARKRRELVQSRKETEVALRP